MEFWWHGLLSTPLLLQDGVKMKKECLRRASAADLELLLHLLLLLLRHHHRHEEVTEVASWRFDESSSR